MSRLTPLWKNRKCAENNKKKALTKSCGRSTKKTFKENLWKDDEKETQILDGHGFKVSSIFYPLGCPLKIQHVGWRLSRFV